MINKILIGFVIALVALLGIAMSLPKDFQFQRSIVVDAPLETVFEQVYDLEKLTQWSPWAAKDPSIQYKYSQARSGEGSWYEWISNDVGSGRLDVIGVEPLQQIKHKLSFEGMGASFPTWSFVAGPDGIETTWAFEGEAGGPLGGVFALMMEGMLAPDFEAGLEALKDQAESAALHDHAPTGVTADAAISATSAAADNTDSVVPATLETE